jgi:phage-related protein
MSKGANEVVIAQSELEENRPIYLYEITVDGGLTLRYAGNNTDDIIFNGYTYTAAAIGKSDTETNIDSQVDQVSITVQNISREFSSYLANDGKINGYTCRILTVMRDALDDPLNYVVDFQGEIDGGTLDGQSFSFKLRRHRGTFDIICPRRRYDPSCQYQFKSEWCGYAGSETLCDRSLSRCQALSNSLNFGGFPGVPRIINPVN